MIDIPIVKESKELVHRTYFSRALTITDEVISCPAFRKRFLSNRPQKQQLTLFNETTFSNVGMNIEIFFVQCIWVL